MYKESIYLKVCFMRNKKINPRIFFNTKNDLIKKVLANLFVEETFYLT